MIRLLPRSLTPLLLLLSATLLATEIKPEGPPGLNNQHHSSAVYASSEPQRFIVLLKDQPILPYMKQQEASLRRKHGQLGVAQKQQLAKGVQKHRQMLQAKQQSILNKMRRERMLGKAHREFLLLSNGIAITAKNEDVNRIRQMPEVAGVYPDTKVYPLLNASVPKIGTPEVWSLKDNLGVGVTGKGIRVAIIDSGIDYRHPDLGGCLGVGCKVIGGYNFVEGENPLDPMDFYGHGTHVAGIVAAKGTLMGVAPDASLLAYKVLRDFWGAESSDVIAALEMAVDPDGDPLTDDKAHVINISLGGWSDEDSPISVAANNAMEAGSVVVVAAGNSGSYSSISSPGNAEKVITVGAVDSADVVAQFSSRGPVQGQTYIKPELVAPGVNIHSTYLNADFKAESGTSMAAPHVAGAVALLRQIQPQLDAAEIKSIVTTTALDIGENVFVQGAGRLNVAAMAQASLVVSPSLLSMGLVNFDQVSWQVSRDLTVKNIGEAPMAVSMLLADPLVSGAELSFRNNSGAMLAPGETATIGIDLNVDVAGVPFGEPKTLHHEAVLSVSGVTSLRLPLVFFKAAKIRVESEGKLEFLRIFSDEGDIFLNAQNMCLESATAAFYAKDFYVRPGKYHVVFNYASQSSCLFREAVVFREGIEVSGNHVVSAKQSDAKNRFYVNNILDADGELVNKQNLALAGSDFSWAHPKSGASDGYGVPSQSMEVMAFSDVSSDFLVGVAALVEDQRFAADDRTYYLLQTRKVQGVSGSEGLNLDLAAAGKVVFDYADLDMLSEGVRVFVKAMLGPPLGGIVSHQIGDAGEEHQTPFKISMYANYATFETGEWYPLFEVIEIPDAEWYLMLDYMLVETGLIAFSDSNSYLKLNGFTEDGENIVFQSSDNFLPVYNSGYLFTGQIRYDTNSAGLTFPNASGCGLGCSGYSLDEYQNRFSDPINYTLRCDGNVVDQQEAIRMFYSMDVAEYSCDQFGVELQLPTRYLGIKNTSIIEFEFPGSSANTDSYALIDTPMLTDLTFFSGNTESRALADDDSRISFKLGYHYADFNQEPSLALEYRLNNVGDWVDLAPTKLGDEYIAKVPMVDGSHIGSLRISLERADGVKLVQTLNSIFSLGRGSAVGAAPTFGSLPRIITEANAKLTNYSLPSVMATDEKDGNLQATTEDLGPYPVGEIAIRWTATNSLGVSAYATQYLLVQDTTPPMVVAPPNIDVQTTGAVAPVEFGSATAIDLVDGVVIAQSDRLGPFEIGVHQVNWAATDSSGNTGRAIQTVTIRSAPVVTPPPTAGAEKKSGGGVIGLWLMLGILLRLYCCRCARRYVD